MTKNINPYITEKTARKEKRGTNKLILYAFLIFIFIITVVDLLKEGNYLSAFIGLLVIIGLAIPLARILLRNYYRMTAKSIAEKLLPLKYERLPFDTLQTTLSLKNPLQKLSALIGKGYLQNILIDKKTHYVVLNKPMGKLVSWVCSSCGAKNSVKTNEPMYCAYCDQINTE